MEKIVVLTDDTIAAFVEQMYREGTPERLSHVDTSQVTVMDHLFAYRAVVPPIGHWNTARVRSMQGMFEYSGMNQPIGDWNTAAVENMSDMFCHARAFNQPLNTWTVDNVTTMACMFFGASAFNQPIGDWNTAAVTTMYGMFHDARAFDQPLNAWNTAAVYIMSDMFRDACAFNQPIGAWNTAAVCHMCGMFSGACAFNQPIGAWNVGNVREMNDMFAGARAFNQPIGTWNTANVATTMSMFDGAVAFNQDLNTWNTAAVSCMLDMFRGATAFRHSVASWDLRKLDYVPTPFAPTYEHILSWQTPWETTRHWVNLHNNRVRLRQYTRYLTMCTICAQLPNAPMVGLLTSVPHILHDMLFIEPRNVPAFTPRAISHECLQLLEHTSAQMYDELQERSHNLPGARYLFDDVAKTADCFGDPWDLPVALQKPWNSYAPDAHFFFSEADEDYAEQQQEIDRLNAEYQQWCDGANA